jgi:hypothetical protein
MAIDRLVGDEIEYFNNAQEIAQEQDRIELDVHPLGWSKKLRIRALSFEQMEKINKMAAYIETNKKENIVAGELNHSEWVYWTLKEGIVRPMMTISQARMLADNNGEFVRELADEIWNLGRISQRMWDAYITEQKMRSELEKTGNPDADETIDTSE